MEYINLVPLYIVDYDIQNNQNTIDGPSVYNEIYDEIKIQSTHYKQQNVNTRKVEYY